MQKPLALMIIMNWIIFFFIILLYLPPSSLFFFFIFHLLLYSSSLLSVRLFLRPYHVRSVLLFGLSLKPLPKLVSGFIFVVGLLFLTETKFLSLRGNDQLLVSTRTELRARSISYLLTSRRRNFFPPSGPIGSWLSSLQSDGGSLHGHFNQGHQGPHWVHQAT